MRKVLLISTVVLTLSLLLAWFWPLPAAFREDASERSTRILDRNGRLLYEVQRGGRQEEVPLRRIPASAINALIAVEDRSFRSHLGISVRGLVRALWNDLLTQSFAEGGSTITQQLVRAKLAPAYRGVLYKLREMWLALKVDARLSKDRILEEYLTAAYFGQQAYGIGAAARTYFSKRPEDLSLGESALLVGLLNAPTDLNPFRNPEGARSRRSRVLRAMRETGVISEDDFVHADAEPVQLVHGRIEMLAPHFVQWLIQQRGAAIAGMSSVSTTIDLALEQDIERSIERRLHDLEEKNVTSAAVVVLDAVNGDLLAMVGSADYFDDAHAGAVNVAVSPRQPGSALKPFTYALAFSEGLTAATTVADIETQFFTQEGNPYIPRNYDYAYHGLVRLREALANSYNIAAVRVLERVGVQTLLDFLRRIGLSTLVETPEHYGLALTLGDSEVTLLELARAYAIFPREGRTLNVRTLLSDPAGGGEQVLSPEVAWLTSDILADPVARAEQFSVDGPLSFPFPVAAKTGTTRNSRDNWTMGFTPDRIVGVWVGNADNSPMRGTSGVTGAGPIFHDVMVAASQGVPHRDFVRPGSIVEATICKPSGKRSTALCPALLQEYFIRGTEPTEDDDMFRQVTVDTRNGLLASDACPERFREKKTFAVFPQDLRRWARENGWKEAPNVLSPLCSPAASAGLPVNSGAIVIVSPGENASFILDPMIPDSSELISFEATAPMGTAALEWRVDGVRVGAGKPPDFRFLWKPIPGEHVVEAAREGKRSAAVRILIERPDASR